VSSAPLRFIKLGILLAPKGVVDLGDAIVAQSYFVTQQDRDIDRHLVDSAPNQKKHSEKYNEILVAA
jgi:hypothetical protein